MSDGAVKFHFQLGDVVVDQDGRDRSAELRLVYDECAKKRTKQLAQSRNVVECRRPPKGELKYAVGMVLTGHELDFNGIISFWSMDDKKKFVGFTEGVRTRSQTRRLNRPFYLFIDVRGFDSPHYYEGTIYVTYIE